MLRTRQPTRQQTEIRTVCRILVHRHLRRLLHRHGIDLTEKSWRPFDEMIFRALRRCAGCAARDACRQWLSEAHPHARHPTFCPNSAVIEACRILDPRALPATKEESAISERREPAITDVLADPIILQLMKADGVEAEAWLGHVPLPSGRGR
jgi:hypothetical protein